jgi:hypothetical protein
MSGKRILKEKRLLSGAGFTREEIDAMAPYERWDAIDHIDHVGDRYKTLEIKESGRHKLRLTQSVDYDLDRLFYSDFHPFGFLRDSDKVTGKSKSIEMIRGHLNREKSDETLDRMFRELAAECNADQGYILTKILACALGSDNIIKEDSSLLLCQMSYHPYSAKILINARHSAPHKLLYRRDRLSRSLQKSQPSGIGL